jgi:GAF domain-containing protein
MMLKRVRRRGRVGSKTQPMMAGASRDLDILLRFSAAVLLALTLLSFAQFLSGATHALLYAAIESGALLATWGVWRLNIRGKTKLSGYLFIVILLAFLTFGIEPAWLLAGPLLSAYVLPIGIAGLLYGPRAGFVVCIAVTGLVILRAATGIALEPGLSLDPLQIALSLLGLYFLALIDWRSAHNLLQALGVAQHSAKEARALGEQLEQYASELEESQRQLTRRAGYLEAASQVAAVAVATLDLQQLLEHTVNLISQRFGFYHTGIFLVDDRREWTVLRAASSVEGQQMIAGGYRLPLGQASLIGYVATRGKSRTVFDVNLDPSYADNPDLPETRSVAALPLKGRGMITGVLEVHSTQPAVFSEEDVAVLQTLADQIAMAISNAQYYQESEENLAALQRAFGQISQDAWLQLLGEQSFLGFRRDRLGVAPLEMTDQAECYTGSDAPAIPASGTQAVGPRKADTSLDTRKQDEAVLVRSVKVRDQVVGVINARKPHEAGQWTVEETSLLETLIGQLEVALEDARLYRESQRHAHFERLTRQITEKVHARPQVQTIVQTAVMQLVETLSSARGFIQLTVDALDSTSGPHTSHGQFQWYEYSPSDAEYDRQQSFGRPSFDRPGTPAQGELTRRTLTQPIPEIDQVLNHGSTSVTSGEDNGLATLVTPIKLRGQIIGALGLQDAQTARIWSEDEVTLVETTAAQVAQALEVAHLLDKTQRLARREQLVGEITGKIRSAPDIDGILHVAVEEMRRALGVSHGLIRLGTESHFYPSFTPDGRDITQQETSRAVDLNAHPASEEPAPSNTGGNLDE